MTSPHDVSPQEMSLIDRVKAYASSAAVSQQPWLALLMADVLFALTAAQVRREQAVRDKIAMHDKAMMPIYGAIEAPSAAELAVGQIVTVVTVTDDGVETERVPWSEIMNPSGGNIDDLGRTQRAAKGHSNVAKHNAAVAETAIAEVDRLRAALETIAGLPDVRCDEAPTVARNTLNDGTRQGPFPTEPDSGPDVLGEQKE